MDGVDEHELEQLWADYYYLFKTDIRRMSWSEICALFPTLVGAKERTLTQLRFYARTTMDEKTLKHFFGEEDYLHRGGLDTKEWGNIRSFRLVNQAKDTSFRERIARENMNALQGLI